MVADGSLTLVGRSNSPDLDFQNRSRRRDSRVAPPPSGFGPGLQSGPCQRTGSSSRRRRRTLPHALSTRGFNTGSNPRRDSKTFGWRRSRLRCCAWRNDQSGYESASAKAPAYCRGGLGDRTTALALGSLRKLVLQSLRQARLVINTQRIGSRSSTAPTHSFPTRTGASDGS